MITLSSHHIHCSSSTLLSLQTVVFSPLSSAHMQVRACIEKCYGLTFNSQLWKTLGAGSTSPRELPFDRCSNAPSVVKNSAMNSWNISSHKRSTWAMFSKFVSILSLWLHCFYFTTYQCNMCFVMKIQVWIKIKLYTSVIIHVRAYLYKSSTCKNKKNLIFVHIQCTMHTYAYDLTSY